MNEQILIKHHKEVAEYLLELAECKKRIDFLENIDIDEEYEINMTVTSPKTGTLRATMNDEEEKEICFKLIIDGHKNQLDYLQRQLEKIFLNAPRVLLESKDNTKYCRFNEVPY